MKKYLLLVPILILVLASLSWADLYSDTRTSIYGIFANDGWADGNFSITWEINNVGGSLPWEYNYTIYAAGLTGGQAISHWIFEVSNVSTARYLFPEDLVVEGPKTWVPGTGNPYMPGDLFGIKFDELSGNPNSFTFYSTQPPMWGDFYAKDGNNPVSAEPFDKVIAYNIGFGTDPTGNDYTNWIAVPDTVTVPEPGILILLGIAMTAIGVASRYVRKI